MLREWAAWRLVLSGLFDYGSVFYGMTPRQIEKANTALDIHFKQQQKER